MILAGRFERNSTNESENLNGMSGKVICVTQGDPDGVKVITHREVSCFIVAEKLSVFCFLFSEKSLSVISLSGILKI